MGRNNVISDRSSTWRPNYCNQYYSSSSSSRSQRRQYAYNKYFMITSLFSLVSYTALFPLCDVMTCCHKQYYYLLLLINSCTIFENRCNVQHYLVIFLYVHSCACTLYFSSRQISWVWDTRVKGTKLEAWLQRVTFFLGGATSFFH